MYSEKLPVQTWRRKLLSLQEAEARTADPSLKFSLKEDIKECKNKIKEYESEEEPLEDSELKKIKAIVPKELGSFRRGDGKSVSSELSALAELMQDPDIRFEVKFFKIDFQSIGDQIMVIADYKALHNQLHYLEFSCYSVILGEFENFPDDDCGLERLSLYEQNLEDRLREIESIMGRKTFQDNTMIMRWIRYISNSKSQLDKALVDKEKECLKNATDLLRRVLSNVPYTINADLHRAACDLKLERLINPMQSISESLTKNEDQEKLSQFNQKVNALKELNERLLALVKVHNVWQDIDQQLRCIEDNLHKDGIMELYRFWPDLKESTKIIFDPPGDKWTESFEQASNNLDTALANHNFSDSQKYFHRYRSRAATMFNEVDAQLHELCQELRGFGDFLLYLF